MIMIIVQKSFYIPLGVECGYVPEFIKCMKNAYIKKDLILNTLNEWADNFESLPRYC